ncbi:MAG: PAS domain S-box protein, partial [Syntrophales bacterium]|nr:PAS domain S-box protein [Syntrophales bacterium]
MKVSDILINVKPVLITDNIGQAVAAFLADDLDILPVADDQGRVVGALTNKEILSALQDGLGLPQDIGSLVNRNIPHLIQDEMLDHLSGDSIPAVVLDSEERIVGVISAKRYAAAMSNKLKSLEDRNKELEVIIDSSYDSISVVDSCGVSLIVNKGGWRLWGAALKPYLGTDIRKLAEKGLIDRSVTQLVMERLEQVTINQTVKTAAGEAVLLVTGTPIFDDKGRLFRIVVNARDISELTRLQNQLSKEKEVALRYKSELVHLRTLQ